MWYLKSLCTGIDFPIDKAVMTVGRHPSHDLNCINSVVSRKHAILILENGNAYVQPLQTVNGTWVNNRRLEDMERLKLHIHDNLNFGYPEHPECGKTEDHYCYEVMLRTEPIRSDSELRRILEGSDVSQDINASEDTDEVSLVEYSKNEDFIMIDDDDDFDIASSQIFIENTTVKTEPASNENIECIEISEDEDDDSDHFNPIGQLSPVEDPLENENINNGEILPNDNTKIEQDENQNITQKDHGKYDKEKEETENITVNSNVLKELVTPQEQVQGDEMKSVNQKNGEPKSMVDRSFILKPKYSKPTVISPHVVDVTAKKRRKSVSKEERNDFKKPKVDKPPRKRKFGNEKKTTDAPPHRGRPRKKTESADTLTSIQRKPQNEEDSSQKLKTQPKNVLTKQNNLIVPDPIASMPIDKIKTISKPSRYPTRRSFRENNSANNLIDKTSSHDLDDPQPSTSKAYLQSLRDPRRKNDANANRMNNFVNDDDLERLAQCHVNRNIRSEPVDVTAQYPILAKPSRDLIFFILGWNIKWLSEQQEISIPPPIIRNDVVRMCTCFNAYNDYCNVVKPFITLELWDSLSQGFKLNCQPKGRFRISIVEVHQYRLCQILHCITYTNDNKKVLNRPKEGDIMMMNIGVRAGYTNGGKSGVRCIYAFVVSCKNSRLKPTDSIYKDLLADNNDISIKLDVHVIVKPFVEEVLITKFVDATILTSITSLLRECDAVMQMNKSPIANMILNPRIENFVVEQCDNLNIDKRGLSEKQFRAVKDACSLCVGNRAGFYMIQGPPGTGKTTVIKQIIEVLAQAEYPNRILVTAPSNATVDGIVRKLAREKCRPDMVRIGIYDSVSPDLKHYFLDEIAKKRLVQQILKERPEVRMDYENLRAQRNNLYEAYEKEKGCSNKTRIDQLLKELKSIDHRICNFANHYYTDDHYRRRLHWMKTEVVTKARIICTTLNSCIRLEEFKLKIDCCIVDEASQSKETETLIPLSLGIEKMVLVGDPQQLPAVTLSKYAKDLEYGQSLFARMKKAFASKNQDPITMLDTQFRMHPEICKFPNKTFYKGMLKTAPICHKRGGLDMLAPYYVLNLNMRNGNTNGYNNRNEIDCVVNLLEAIHETIGNKPNKYYTVGVITPYNSQRRDLLLQIEKLRLPSMGITVNTVDSFQGSEKDIIILSCVRIRANSFLNDEQRLNVAITRARRVLYVVGTNPLFDTCPTLKNLKSDAESRKLYLNIHDIRTVVLKSLIQKMT